MDDEKELTISILLEEYRFLSEELQLYAKAMINCFPYAAILIAIYLGWGLGDTTQPNSVASKIHQYIPYSAVILAVYFLALAYLNVGLKQYKADLERRINQIVGKELLQWDSKITGRIQTGGFLKLGDAWYKQVPTPVLLLGIILAIAFYLRV